MTKTTIRISQELLQQLNKLKYHYGYKSIEEVIKHHTRFYISEKQNGNNNEVKNPVEEVQDEEIY